MLYNCFVSSVVVSESEVESDAYYDDFTLYLAGISVSSGVSEEEEEKEGLEKREIERQLLEQWAKDIQSKARPSGVREFWESYGQKEKTVETLPRNSEFSKSPLACRMTLVQQFPAKIWSLSPSLIARMHRLRHAPAARMIKFFIAATPIGARETPEFSVW